jgi:predicted DNA-binding transcriptional regulator AlpA
MSAITIDQFCDLEKITRVTWYRLCERGEAPRHYKIGSCVRIELKDIEIWREQTAQSFRSALCICTIHFVAGSAATWAAISRAICCKRGVFTMGNVLSDTPNIMPAPATEKARP